MSTVTLQSRRVSFESLQRHCSDSKLDIVIILLPFFVVVVATVLQTLTSIGGSCDLPALAHWRASLALQTRGGEDNT